MVISAWVSSSFVWSLESIVASSFSSTSNGGGILPYFIRISLWISLYLAVFLNFSKADSSLKSSVILHLGYRHWCLNLSFSIVNLDKLWLSCLTTKFYLHCGHRLPIMPAELSWCLSIQSLQNSTSQLLHSWALIGIPLHIMHSKLFIMSLIASISSSTNSIFPS